MKKPPPAPLEKLSLPQQNYVEVVDELVRKHGHAHTSDIAKSLGVKKPSVTEAVTRLVDTGITRRSGPEITLTEKGRRLARELEHRHRAFRMFMTEVLEIEETRADQAACRVEHHAGDELVDRLLLLQEFMAGPAAGAFKKAWHDFLRCRTTAETGE